MIERGIRVGRFGVSALAFIIYCMGALVGLFYLYALARFMVIHWVATLLTVLSIVVFSLIVVTVERIRASYRVR